MALDVTEPATLILQIAPVPVAGTVLSERFDVTVDGRPVEMRQLRGDHGSLVHVLHSTRGELKIDFETTVDREPLIEQIDDGELDHEQLVYLRQSRYCPSDQLRPFAIQEFDATLPGAELLEAVGTWVSDRLSYEEGSSGPLDTALDTLLAGRGVCRDFAHLSITLLRALGIPARLVAVYAPGLSPMDFHAVVEAHVEGRWTVLDATRLAPRQTLLRVSTGRDAADTAFLTVLDGEAALLFTEVVAYTDRDLPLDDHTGLVGLA
jgi:transglutaminase-like putative cysteine protease